MCCELPAAFIAHGCCREADVAPLLTPRQIIDGQKYVEQDSESEKCDPWNPLLVCQEHHHERSQYKDGQNDRDNNI